ncbi:MSMEG_0565 family glycosyltransferase [Ancylobacter lacus]|uniref:MSMEG_0565 family glycosyltransferase n=1 Tax=Ancylobacter lacus TaxID=2579970 RepID=UPI001BD172FA|nr:MSMEG_0565 family glycosyltransferase [Ancylobacter lacus]MBS7539025.1 MSMEG_0565 family glycosyltransferase [Ancylobacter lacus]
MNGPLTPRARPERARPLRIAILTHSTNPRGGVVHALELADALVRLGHEPVVHAPDPRGTGFFRPTLTEVVGVPASPAGPDVAEMVRRRAADYVRHFEVAAHRRFDVWHAQDGISGNALADLKRRGLIDRFARTVHHIDSFRDPRLLALQERAIHAASEHFVVSRLWRDELVQRYGLAPTLVGNGVDTSRYSARPAPEDAALRARLGLGRGPVILSVGGVEARKNTVRLLEAFAQLHAVHPTAQLVIAGGASVLDHHDFRDRFAEAFARSGLPAAAVLETGPLPQVDMPALYRLAHVLAFPSLTEGFGLVVLEAMASGTPCVVSRIAPFTEHLRDDEVAWCNPESPASIANAIGMALGTDFAASLRARGLRAARRHDWEATALAHIPLYRRLAELQHA